MMSINMNLQETIRRVLKEERKPSNSLRRRFDILDYEIEKSLNSQFSGINLCIIFKNDIEFFESVMENSIDFMYYNHFSNMDDNSGEWAHTYLDMVNYIRENYQYKIMKHYDDNCGSGLIPIKESTFFRRRIDVSLINKEFFENLNIITDVYLKKYNKGVDFNFETFENHLINYLMDGYYNELTNGGENEYPYDKVYEFLLNYFHDKIKDRYDTFFGNKINESVDKSEDKKLKLVKDIIYNMFDDIIDLEYNTERNEIMVYYDKQETLESSEICDIINDFTGLNVVPWYVYDKRVELKKEPDFYIDTERYEEEIYENYNPTGKEITPKEIELIHEGNVINESENKLNILLNRHFDEVFDNLTLVIDNGGYCRWFFNDEDIPEDDHDDDSVFSKNLAGTLWVQNCDEFRKLVDVRTYLSLSAHEIKIKLMRYINNRYREQFLQGFFGTDGFVKIVDSHHCVDLYGLLP